MILGIAQSREPSAGACSGRVASGKRRGAIIRGLWESDRPKQRVDIEDCVATTVKMIRQDAHRIDPKRRTTLDHKKKQFATPIFKQQDYPHRLNFYEVPPTAEITLEEFEQWAIDRLKSEYPGDLVLF